MCRLEAPSLGRIPLSLGQHPMSSWRSDINGTEKKDSAKHIPPILLPVAISPAVPSPKHPPCWCRGANVQRGTGAPPTSENLKALILTIKIFCFTEESLGEEKGSCVASRGAQA